MTMTRPTDTGRSGSKCHQLDGGLIISIRPDSYEVYPIDLPKARSTSAPARMVAGPPHGGQGDGHKWAPRRPVATDPECDCGETEAARREGLYDRFDKLTKDQQEQFVQRKLNIDTSDLDAVEELLDNIINPPKIIDLARQRMARDATHEADRRLAAEGGPANPEDVTVFEARWELGLNKPGRSGSPGSSTKPSKPGATSVTRNCRTSGGPTSTARSPNGRRPTSSTGTTMSHS